MTLHVLRMVCGMEIDMPYYQDSFQSKSDLLPGDFGMCYNHQPILWLTINSFASSFPSEPM